MRNEPLYHKSTNNMSALEEIAADELLIELLNNKKAEVFENVVFSGKKRYYIEDLSKRDFRLENTTPYQIELFGNVIDEHSWGIMLCQIVNLLMSLFPRNENDLLSFRTEWSKATIYSLEQKTNYKAIDNNLFFNCNHTALHSCWLLQDLLDFYSIDKSMVHFLIHRPCSAEPENVKTYILKRFKNGFAVFLSQKYQLSSESADKVILNIEKHLNPMLSKVSKSYTNFFLFDDNATMYNYVKKVRELILKSGYDDRAKKLLNMYLDFLTEYYKI